MKAAIVSAPGQTPHFGDIEAPEPQAGEVAVTVSAAALSQVVRSRASGTHYSTTGRFPIIAGLDGVGRLADGQRVYFLLPRAPYGSMAERSVVAAAQVVPLPDDLDDVVAAAIANPGLSSWAAYAERARLRPGETVLVNGATGTAGRLAVQIAKHLGAARVIATGRDAAALDVVTDLGADAIVRLDQDAADLAATVEQHFAAGVDVVVDYLWGRSAETLLVAAARAGAEAVPIRFVQIGSASGPDITLPSPVLRSSAIELMGSGLGSVPAEAMLRVAGDLLRAVTPAKLGIDTLAMPLADVEHAWASEGRRRIVLTTGA